MCAGTNSPARFAPGAALGRGGAAAPALPGTRVGAPGPLTIAALVLAEPVLAAQQVEGRVQVHVDLVHAIADGLQRHPPVRGLRRLLAPRRPPAAGRDPQQQQRGQQRQPGRGHAEPAKPPPSPAPPARPGPLLPPPPPPPPPPWSPRPRPCARPRGGTAPAGRPWQRRGALRVPSAVCPLPCAFCRVPSAVSPVPCHLCRVPCACSLCPVPSAVLSRPNLGSDKQIPVLVPWAPRRCPRRASGGAEFCDDVGWEGKWPSHVCTREWFSWHRRKCKARL